MAGSHRRANYRHRDTTLSPTEVSDPFPITPNPADHNKAVHLEADGQLPLSAQSTSPHVPSQEKSKWREQEAEEVSSKHQVLSSFQGNNDDLAKEVGYL